MWTFLHTPIRRRETLMMGPCADPSRESIPCMARKCCIFAHFALKILLTASASGTVTNSIAVLRSNNGGRLRGDEVCPAGAHNSPPLIFASPQARACGALLVARGGDEVGSPSIFTHLPCPQASIAIGRIVNPHHCTALCYYDNALQIICAGGFLWMDACVCGRLRSVQLNIPLHPFSLG